MPALSESCYAPISFLCAYLAHRIRNNSGAVACDLVLKPGRSVTRVTATASRNELLLTAADHWALDVGR